MTDDEPMKVSELMDQLVLPAKVKRKRKPQ